MRSSATRLKILIVVCLANATCTICAQPLFGPREPFGANINAVQVPFIADIDNDGSKEVILGSTSWGEVVALKLVGDSVTQLARIIPKDLRSIVMNVADINNDGIADLIRSRTQDNNENSSLCLAVYLGIGDGQFAPPITTATGTNFYRVESADITGDGLPELIAFEAGWITIYDFDTALESFVFLRSIQIQNGTQGILTVDVTGDGIEDLVIYPGNGTSPLVAFDATLGMDSPLITLSSNTGYIGTLLVADINNDGRMDLFASNSTGGLFSVYLCTGGSSFTRSSMLPLGPSFNFPTSVGPFVDIDQNGIVELLHVEHNALVRTELPPDLSIGTVDTLAVVPDEILSFKFNDLDSDGNTDILIISQNMGLFVAHGGNVPEIFDAPVPLFSWNNLNNVVLTAVDPDMNGRDQLAMISSEIVSDLVLFNEGPWEGPPRIIRSPMQEGQPAFLNSSFMETYDLDNDGDADLIGYQAHDFSNYSCDLFCMEDSAGVYVQRCLGSPITDSLTGYFYSYHSLTALDVNGDGLADLLCQGSRIDGFPPANSVQADFVLTQTAPMQFELGSVPLPMDHYTNHYDLDGDGLDELLVQSNPDEVTIYHNEGGGVFIPLSSMSTDGPIGSLWADANGDGVKDLISNNYLGGIQEVAYRTVTLNSVSAKTIMFSFPTNGEYQRTIPADLDQDGLLDMLFISATNTPPLELFAYMNYGSYPLTVAELVDTNVQASIFTMDVDGDGDLDIVSHNMASFFFYLNNAIVLSTSEFQGYVPRSISIHPNPGSDNFIIDLPASFLDCTISLLDITGRVVLRQSVSAGSGIVNTTTISPGLFVYRLMSASGEVVASGKWVKE